MDNIYKTIEIEIKKALAEKDNKYLQLLLGIHAYMDTSKEYYDYFNGDANADFVESSNAVAR